MRKSAGLRFFRPRAFLIAIWKIAPAKKSGKNLSAALFNKISRHRRRNLKFAAFAVRLKACSCGCGARRFVFIVKNAKKGERSIKKLLPCFFKFL